MTITFHEAPKKTENLVMVVSKSRSHGFERPFGFFQVLSWIIAAFIFISFAITVITLLLIDNVEDWHL